MTQPDADRDPLDVLADDFLERMRRGEEPAVEEYAAAHPHLADDIRDLFPTILAVERAKQAHDATPAGPAAGSLHIERLGDFRIIRELGRGGMGIVYEAEQESLRRRVAIKILPQQFLPDQKRRERFDREAKTAAGLHHTNIVPIFGIGHHDGYHYFVMQYIRGVGLDAVFRALTAAGGLTQTAGSLAPSGNRSQSTATFLEIARELLAQAGADHSLTPRGSRVELDLGASTLTHPVRSIDAAPSPASPPDGNQPDKPTSDSSPSHAPRHAHHWRSLARLIAQAADALAYAHSQGVLHRDVKPGNLLLDAEGTLWVADFGLAKAADHDGITQAGDVLGTLRYMAPEQFRNQFDARSDVYSLGITLYELAALRPAFGDTQRSALIHAIIHGPLTPPRQFVPDLPGDLETIILKAVAREPDHRYPTAGALRDDLRRFIEDRPIHARRVSGGERLWRWARRNPALAATTGLAAALLLSVAVVASAAYFHVHGANALANRQRLRAEATAGLAVEALDAIFNEFAPQSSVETHQLSVDDDQEVTLSVAVPPVVSTETAKLLHHMLDFYRRLAEQDSESRPLRIKVAEAQRRVGDIYERLGEHDKGREAYVDSIRKYNAILDAEANDADVVVALARAENHLGELIVAGGDKRGAEAHFEAAQSRLESVVAAHPASAPARFELARTFYLLAKRPLGERPGGPGRGRPRNGPGRGPFGPDEGPPPESDDQPPMGFDGFPPDFEMGPPPGHEGGPPPDGDDGLPPDDEDGPPPEFGDEPRPDVGDTPVATSAEGRPRGRPPFGRRSRGPGGRGRPPGPRSQGPAGPGDADFDLRPDPQRIRAALDRAVEILTPLCEENPKQPEYRHLLAQCLREYPPAPPQRGDPSGPGDETHAAELDRAIGILEALVQAYPHVPEYRFDLYETLARQDRGPGARENLDKAVAGMKELIDERPTVPEYKFALGHMYMRLAGIHRRERDREGAESDLREALKLQSQLAADHPTIPPYTFACVVYESALARALVRRDELTEARTLLESAVARIESRSTQEQRHPHLRRLVSAAYRLLVEVLDRLGDTEAAEAVREKAAVNRDEGLPRE